MGASLCSACWASARYCASFLRIDESSEHGHGQLRNVAEQISAETSMTPIVCFWAVCLSSRTRGIPTKDPAQQNTYIPVNYHSNHSRWHLENNRIYLSRLPIIHLCWSSRVIGPSAVRGCLFPTYTRDAQGWMLGPEIWPFHPWLTPPTLAHLQTPPRKASPPALHNALPFHGSASFASEDQSTKI